MRRIEICRTAALGGHLDVCDSCGDSRPSYNSCRDRHCPKCQSLRQARWIAARVERILDIPHFHVVFTIPRELRPIALSNRKRFFEILFETASATLLTLGQDPQRIGGLLGITAVLHTWTRSLTFHPHLHCLVTGGALSPDGSHFIRAQCDGNYLFPKAVLAPLFRGKFLAALSLAIERGEVRLPEPDAFSRIKDELYRKKWVVYCKKPFGGAKAVFQYLGRYTHRVGISNQRLLGMDDKGVTFLTKDGGTCTLAPPEFIRRFLMHVLPRGFVKIRHFGLLAAGNVNSRLEAARLLLARSSSARELTPTPEQIPAPAITEPEKPLASAAQEGDAANQQKLVGSCWRELFRLLTGTDLSRCRACGKGTIVQRPLPRTLQPIHLPAIHDSS